MQLIQKKGSQKIDYRADRTHESHPTAWELKHDHEVIFPTVPEKSQREH